MSEYYICEVIYNNILKNISQHYDFLTNNNNIFWDIHCD